MTEMAAAFARERYMRLPALVVDPLRGFLWRYVRDREATGTLRSDPRWPGTPIAANDVVMEHLLERLRPQIETASGLRLFPTYSYFRLYKQGNALSPHRDRPACEISVSLHLGQDTPVAWPLWFDAPSGPCAVELGSGDGVLYRGTELEHWREAYTGTRSAQVFLHYVDRDGPYAEWKYDKRDGLSTDVRLPI